jgi:ABC-type polysaccharide/polyol phosphate transport system, ATPase component
MSLPAIEVSGLSKRYVIQHESRHDNLRDTLHHTARKLWRRVRWGTGFSTEEFWALRDVSFSVQPGEVVGIIGRNGAGKSTLLKILSRITEPTSGKVKLRGRVASLLEVGTGFHPELTGRENIFLNGAILGMSRAEIRKKFDEIVAFSEVEQFLDTPVKRYSSGMYVRLAFAVAAHLEPEILIVDEVLAVGDAQFQQKCLGKMQSVATAGRTVLLVSHNMTSVLSLCTSCCLLERGRLSRFEVPEQAVNHYHESGNRGADSIDFPLTRFELIDDRDQQPVDAVPIGGSASFIIEFSDRFDCGRFDIVISFKHPKWNRLLSLSTHHRSIKCSTNQARRYKCRMDNIRLLPGLYTVEALIREPRSTRTGGVITMKVVEADIYASGVLPDSNYSAFAAEQHWEAIPASS